MNMEGIAANPVACPSVLIACSDLQAVEQDSTPSIKGMQNFPVHATIPEIITA